MAVSNLDPEHMRERTRRSSSKASVFLPSLAGADDESGRVVIRNDVHQKALESARKVLRLYYSERRRQL